MHKLLIVSIKNQLLLPFAYMAFAKLAPLAALVGESQFALEAAALALLAGWAWVWSRR